MSRLFTIGHSSRPLDEFLTLLDESGIQYLVDVRSMPGSRTFPQYDADALKDSLSTVGIHYRHMAALGGRRARSLPVDDVRNAMWRNKSFRYYADYALSDAFDQALLQLEKLAADQRCACMCAEAVWWRCHRRIVTDHLLARGHTVQHIMGPGKVMPATLTPGAKADGRVVTYPPTDDLFVAGKR